ncbi:GNAT family N-acetyltransferase [Stackebrandtia nassauensis]|uniref:GCN5-related N-acetyltransferase n=1 Tax=Stackebrandtia nassauensis (strain DSM 44728 / CIP 108903 / NRRL B-16338 / NBRC 102104 / LLR-40K-21) TaxID=446470 RepID=D3Q6E0_STANL|nr:GNAT family N-acetyltransferase [Stackebrandtia nassauensis]ADD42315.1 GCN5-related N-acetyltransferase [Stackebrandtia nassauensis DSM 44728]
MARTLTTDDILRISAQWQWTPFDAVVREDEHVKVVVSNGRATVLRAEAEPGGAEALVSRVRELAAEADPDCTVMWPIHAATEPPDLAEVLARVGAKVEEELDVVALRLPDPDSQLDAPTDVDVRRIDDPALLPDAHQVSSAVFGTPLPTAEFQEREAADVRKQVASGPARVIFRYVAYADGEPVGAAGTTLEDGVAKLWGGSVVESHRGRGVYRALLKTRMDEAAALGADLALVKARTGTSGPILRRAGFTVHGREYVYGMPARG